VVSRPGQPLHDLQAMLPSGLTLEQELKAEPVQPREQTSKIELRCYLLGDQSGRRAPFYLLPDLEIPISASQIRERISKQAGEENPAVDRGLLPEAVARYIESRGLYR